MKRNRSDEKILRSPSGAAVLRGDLTAALCRALFEDWAEAGYQAISLERVAARAGAGKAAIYRRWGSKSAFAEAAMEAVRLPLSRFPAGNSLEQDLLAYLLLLRRGLRHPLIRRILPDLIAEQARSPELRPAMERLAQFRRAEGMELLQRAIDRGELPVETDREFALDLIPSPLWWRMAVRRQRISRADLQEQARRLALALRA